jgi:hypothetical protein
VPTIGIPPPIPGFDVPLPTFNPKYRIPGYAFGLPSVSIPPPIPGFDLALPRLAACPLDLVD